MLEVGGLGWRVVVKQQKHVKIFTGNFQFNFCAAKKKPIFCHPALDTITKSRGDTYDKTRLGTAYIGKTIIVWRDAILQSMIQVMS